MHSFKKCQLLISDCEYLVSLKKAAVESRFPSKLGDFIKKTLVITVAGGELGCDLEIKIS